MRRRMQPGAALLLGLAGLCAPVLALALEMTPDFTVMRGASVDRDAAALTEELAAALPAGVAFSQFGDLHVAEAPASAVDAVALAEHVPGLDPRRLGSAGGDLVVVVTPGDETATAVLSIARQGDETDARRIEARMRSALSIAPPPDARLAMVEESADGSDWSVSLAQDAPPREALAELARLLRDAGFAVQDASMGNVVSAFAERTSDPATAPDVEAFIIAIDDPDAGETLLTITISETR